MTLSPRLGSASLMCNLAPLLRRTWLMMKPPCTQPGASQTNLGRSSSTIRRVWTDAPQMKSGLERKEE